MNYLCRLTQHIKQFLTPPFCAFCKTWLADNTIFCTDCAEEIRPVIATSITVGTYKMPVYALSAYQDPLKGLILSKKWSHALASKQMGILLSQRLPNSCNATDYIIPIPLHWTRYAWRGYNQAELIAQEVATHIHTPVHTLLQRNRRTLFQAGLTAQQRSINVSQVFSVRSAQKKLYQGSRLLLVDDLMTTGATLHAAAKALLPLRPASLEAVVICRVI